LVIMRGLDCVWLALALTSCAESSVSGGGSRCEAFTCVWTTEAGSLEQIGSWNEHDYAYRMVGTPARISRVIDSSGLPACLEFELNANVGSDAQLELQLDFGVDGVIDARIPIEPGRWTKRRLYQPTPRNSRHLALAFDKAGAGDAAINYIAMHEGTRCTGVLSLANGSPCLEDGACTSGACVQGTCSACGAGGCGEGSICREGRDCMSGACAAGVCRACAASGSCGEGEACSAANQCASKACMFGSQPSLVHYPFADGACAECDADADCASGRHCVQGFCASCVTDADCPRDQRCRYQGTLDATSRSCVPRFDGILPRGSLCEDDAECADRLRCGAGPGRAKRCGVACSGNADCGANEVCSSAGILASTTQAGEFELLPAFRSDAKARITTCYPPAQDYRCEVSAQCAASPYDGPSAFTACCEGTCSVEGVSLSSGECRYAEPTFTWLN
jgi:hypothetical protein